MTAGAGTGHGATISFPGSPSLGDGSHLIRDLNLMDNAGESADLSHLGLQVFRQYAKVDLYSVGPMSFNVLFRTIDVETADTHDPLFIPGVRAQMVLNYPIRVQGNLVRATMTGYGWLESRNYGTLASNQEQLASVALKWETQPTWAPEAAA